MWIEGRSVFQAYAVFAGAALDDAALPDEADSVDGADGLALDDAAAAVSPAGFAVPEPLLLSPGGTLAELALRLSVL